MRYIDDVGDLALEPRVVNRPDAVGFGFRSGDLVHVGVGTVQKYVTMNAADTAPPFPLREKLLTPLRRCLSTTAR